MTSERRQRLLEELNGMRQLADGSSIIFFESIGEAPDTYKVRFKGRLVTRESSVSPVEEIEEHTCDIRLPFSFPETAPDIRFTSAVYHPNISSGGFVDLSRLGLEWTADLTLAVVCERLWDACRLAVYNVEGCTNVSAGEWMEDECQLRLPLDDRPLRDQADKSCSNVIQYKRRGGATRTLTASTGVEPDILFIGDDVPPVVPAAQPPAAQPPVSSPRVSSPPAQSQPAPPPHVAATTTPDPPGPPEPDLPEPDLPEPDLPEPGVADRASVSEEEIFYIGDDETGER